MHLNILQSQFFYFLFSTSLRKTNYLTHYLLFVITGAKWHNRRKMWSAFDVKILESFHSIFVEHATFMAQSIKDSNNQTVDDLGSFISHHMLNVLIGKISNII